MMVFEGLVVFLEGQLPSAGKGYPGEVPQDAVGWAYSVITDVQDIAHDGPQNFYKARIQIDLLYNATEEKSAYLVTREIAASMRGLLDGYKGDMGDVHVQFCRTELADDWADLQETPSTRFDVVLTYKL